MVTRVATINTSQFNFRIGNGGSPETFSIPCMINTQRGIVFSSSTTETVVPYCPPDEDLAGWIEREGDALSAAFNGDGVFNGERLDVERFWDWFVQQTSKNVHVVMGQVGYWSGAFLCTGFEASGAGRREKVQFSGSFISDGPIVWVATT